MSDTPAVDAPARPERERVTQILARLDAAEQTLRTARAELEELQDSHEDHARQLMDLGPRVVALEGVVGAMRIDVSGLQRHVSKAAAASGGSVAALLIGEAVLRALGWLQ